MDFVSQECMPDFLCWRIKRKSSPELRQWLHTSRCAKLELSCFLCSPIRLLLAGFAKQRGQGSKTQHLPIIFLQWGWWNPGTGCPEEWSMPHPWKHSRSGWMGLWATWCSWRCPCSWQGDWMRWPLKVPANPNYSTILWSPAGCWDVSIGHIDRGPHAQLRTGTQFYDSITNTSLICHRWEGMSKTHEWARSCSPLCHFRRWFLLWLPMTVCPAAAF